MNTTKYKGFTIKHIALNEEFTEYHVNGHEFSSLEMAKAYINRDPAYGYSSKYIPA